MTNSEVDAQLRSYGRRRGRKASPRQEGLKRDLLPRVALDLSAPSGRLPAGEPEGALSAVSVDTPSSRRPPSTAPSGRLPAGESEGASQVWLEIGFGGGEHLLWQAADNPRVTLIGCEPFEDGVVKVLSAIEQDQLQNIRLHMGDARDVLRWLAPASVDRAFILFPDPWPKRKHRKRRLVNPVTLKLLARVMKPGAQLRIGTDIGDYARTMLQAFRTQSDFAWQAQGPADWRVRPADWPQTRYEQKAEREGRVRYYFRFTRTDV